MSRPASPFPAPETGNLSLPEAVGRFHTWWRGDPLPPFPAWPELSLTPVADARLFSTLTASPLAAVQVRLRHGHRPWLARVAEEPVAWGWCATTELAIGELDLAVAIPPGIRYLWDFITVPAWRGHGIYPRLLQAIVAGEREAERFWLGHDMANLASARGIAKAGFHEVGILYRLPDGAYVLDSRGSRARAHAAARLFGVTVGTMHSSMPA